RRPPRRPRPPGPGCGPRRSRSADRCRPAAPGHPPSGRTAPRTAPGSAPSHRPPLKSGNRARTGQRHQVDLAVDAGFEADGGAGGDVEPLALRRRPLELECTVHLGELEVRTHLHGPVPGVTYAQRRALPPGIQHHRLACRNDLTRPHHRIPSEPATRSRRAAAATANATCTAARGSARTGTPVLIRPGCER